MSFAMLKAISISCVQGHSLSITLEDNLEPEENIDLPLQ